MNMRLKKLLVCAVMCAAVTANCEAGQIYRITWKRPPIRTNKAKLAAWEIAYYSIYKDGRPVQARAGGVYVAAVAVDDCKTHDISMTATDIKLNESPQSAVITVQPTADCVISAPTATITNPPVTVTPTATQPITTKP